MIPDWHLFNTADDITPNELKRMVEESLSQEKGDFTMTIAERLRQKGFEQGIQQGVREWLVIQDCERLRSIKNTTGTAEDISELKALIGN